MPQGPPPNGPTRAAGTRAGKCFPSLPTWVQGVQPLPRWYTAIEVLRKAVADVSDDAELLRSLEDFRERARRAGGPSNVMPEGRLAVLRDLHRLFQRSLLHGPHEPQGPYMGHAFMSWDVIHKWRKQAEGGDADFYKERHLSQRQDSPLYGMPRDAFDGVSMIEWSRGGFNHEVLEEVPEDVLALRDQLVANARRVVHNLTAKHVVSTPAIHTAEGKELTRKHAEDRRRVRRPGSRFRRPSAKGVPPP